MPHKKTTPQSSKKPYRWIILLALVAVIAAVALLWPRPSGATAAYPSEISVDQALSEREAGAFILDVRQPEEWNEIHIPDSTLIPLDELPNRLKEVPRDQKIVVVCRSGNRSKSGRNILLQNGFEQVTSMQGGVNQWRDKGYPTVSGP